MLGISCTSLHLWTAFGRKRSDSFSCCFATRVAFGRAAFQHLKGKVKAPACTGQWPLDSLLPPSVQLRPPTPNGLPSHEVRNCRNKGREREKGWNKILKREGKSKKRKSKIKYGNPGVTGKKNDGVWKWAFCSGQDTYSKPKMRIQPTGQNSM